MALDIDWYVYVGELYSPTDFTSRVQGMTISQPLELNALASFTAQITLRNFDGALTPNGGGTYGTVDWFSQSVLIQANVTGGASNQFVDVMFGLVTGFDLQDNGVESYVTLTVDDVWTVAGRTKQATVAAIASQSPITYFAGTGGISQFSSSFPQFGYGAPTISIYDYNVAGSVKNVSSTVAADGLTFADLLNQLVMPALNGFLWPGKALVPATFYVYAYLRVLQGQITAPTSTFTFDSVGSISVGELPVSTLRQGWTINDTINTATNTSLDQPFGAIPITSTDTVAAGKYGTRAVTYNQSAAVAGLVVDLTAELTNRFATPTFGPLELAVSLSAIRANCQDGTYAQLARLLSLDDGFGCQANVTWKGAGAATQTAKTVILSKRIMVTPSETQVMLTLGQWANYHVWTWDQDYWDQDKWG